MACVCTMKDMLIIYRNVTHFTPVFIPQDYAIQRIKKNSRKQFYFMYFIRQ